ncbi:hypothetical protein NP233_g461 [Leucocoprinus birnbaumii]|uniref:DUF6534 domain-containing protein n=1 Tax=Leucocoprinus birnbaumii TaxID=56174 RepID=A0AAD5W295_9AGAR|nr:hypothetical protein NP233_g461 [Leucocoprinus birnbaumii]
MPPPIPLLFGPMLIGAFFNTTLYGVLILQALLYYQNYKRRDSKWLKLFVLYLVVAETLNSGFSIGLLYEPLILKFGQPAATTFFPLLLPAARLRPALPYSSLGIAISTPIQLFIAWRISVINRRWWISAVIGVLALISSSGGIWLAWTVVHVQRFARKPDLHWPALMWLLASAIADVLITVSLVYSLARRKTGFVQTDDTINKIIRMTVQTGLITAIFAVLDVICFLVLPNTTLNFVWDLALSKLYTNALMSTLNARQSLGQMLSPGQSATNYSTGLTNVLFSDESFMRSHGSHGLSSEGTAKPPGLSTFFIADELYL